MRVKDPESWYAEVLKALRAPKTDVRRRLAIISFLGEDADPNTRARRALENRLESDRQPTIRAACAEALEGTVTTHSGTARLLLSCLQKDKSERVRAR